MQGQPLSSASPEGRYPGAAGSRRPVSLPLLASFLLAGGLAACNTTGNLGVEQPAVPTIAAPPTTVPVAELVGNWGFASYHDEKDRGRTEAEAKSACGNPYKITQGPNGGVMMYLADQNKPAEVFVKQTPDGRSFIGPRGAPGMAQDRVVTFYQNGMLITVWLDKSAQQRYGTMVFVRCS